MTLLRKVGALIFAALSLLLGFVAVIWGLSADGVERTVQNAHEIEKTFSLASGFVEGFKKNHGHLPSEAEFTGWTAAQFDKAYNAKGLRLLTSQSQFPSEVLKEFGSSPEGGYIIEVWRGEWFEYFVSWANASTLEFDAKKFYFSGSSISDGLAILALSVVVGFIGCFLWPRPTLCSNVTPRKRGALSKKSSLIIMLISISISLGYLSNYLSAPYCRQHTRLEVIQAIDREQISMGKAINWVAEKNVIDLGIEDSNHDVLKKIDIFGLKLPAPWFYPYQGYFPAPAAVEYFKGDGSSPWAYIKTHQWDLPFIVKEYYGWMAAALWGKGGVKYYLCFFGIVIKFKDSNLWIS